MDGRKACAVLPTRGDPLDDAACSVEIVIDEHDAAGCPAHDCPGRFVASGLAEWAASLERLQRRARAGVLDPVGRATYTASRDDLERAVLAAQELVAHVHHARRRAVRLGCALQLDLRIADREVRAVTLDLSRSGFATLLESPPPVDTVVELALRLPPGELVKGTARVAALQPRAGSVRVSFAFAKVAEGDIERVRMWIVESVVHQLRLC